MKTETNTKTKHTPGPWTYSIAHKNEYGVQVFCINQSDEADSAKNGRENHLAEVYEDEANARLIAAAPEVLARLTEAQRIIENALAVMTNEQKRQWGEMNDRDDLAGTGVARSDVRMAAIAKAEGWK